MPIPPRPIPTHHAQSRHHVHPRARPGSSVPRKGGYTTSFISESRAEMALLPDPTIPRSIPVGLSGIRISATLPRAGSLSSSLAADHAGTRAAAKMSTSASLNSAVTDQADGETKAEVPLTTLIDAGKNKREKRSTTASALGFDFISNPTITPIPDHLHRRPISSSMMTTSTALANTPTTPLLMAREEEGDDDDNEWECVDVDRDAEDGSTVVVQASGQRMVTVDDGDDDDDDIVILGELELEDVVESEGLAAAKGKAKGIKGMMADSKLSYAAAAKS